MEKNDKILTIISVIIVSFVLAFVVWFIVTYEREDMKKSSVEGIVIDKNIKNKTIITDIHNKPLKYNNQYSKTIQFNDINIDDRIKYYKSGDEIYIFELYNEKSKE